MKTIIKNKQFQVKETNGRYYYFTPSMGRWLPVAKANVIF